MANKLIISYDAEMELYEAYEWYEVQRAGLGEMFLEEINKVLRPSSIAHNISALLTTETC